MATADGTGLRLLNNVQVYAIAEKYFIERLKGVARAKFQSQAESLMFVNEFPEIIRQFMDLAVKRLATIVEIGEFGLDILRETVKYREGWVEKVTAALKKKVKKKNEQMAAIKTRMTRLVKDIKEDKISDNRGEITQITRLL
ncbi:hypothetical protein V501_02486 [Pseudogymnoascus sp. VKM F-4519 (FW-2642)]|nr:hypothetical protein V501_02486 [Pseudogymnoascus sp. VKM F-4519 (FW-2642)]